MTNYEPGELLSCDDVGPINPLSMDGHSRFFLFRDTRTRKKHFFAIKNNDSETFIKCFEFVIDYYESKGYKVKILRSDYFSTFVAADLKKFYNKKNIVHQASSPHRHHQNAVERDIQTLIGYVSAVLHGTELLRADAWERAAAHWVQLSNDLPITYLGTSPNAVIKPGDYVDSHWQYRFAFGDLVCFHIDKIHRTWKFDTRNEIGFYMETRRALKVQSGYIAHTDMTDYFETTYIAYQCQTSNYSCGMDVERQSDKQDYHFKSYETPMSTFYQMTNSKIWEQSETRKGSPTNPQRSGPEMEMHKCLKMSQIPMTQ